MERLLALWVEALSTEEPDGSTLRDSLALLDALSLLCPFSELVRLGFYVLPLRGPSRFFGGEEAVLKMARETVRDVTGHEALLGVADGVFCAELAAREQRELLATIYLRRGFSASAAEEWLAVCADDPDVRALLGLARIARAQGMNADAAVFAARALELDPSNGEAQRLAASSADPPIEVSVAA